MVPLVQGWVGLLSCLTLAFSCHAPSGCVAQQWRMFFQERKRERERERERERDVHEEVHGENVTWELQR